VELDQHFTPELKLQPPDRLTVAISAIVQLRWALIEGGHDAGAQTITHHLAERLAQPPPSVATIWRILKRQGLITPQPHKRPRFRKASTAVLSSVAGNRSRFEKRRRSAAEVRGLPQIHVPSAVKSRWEIGVTGAKPRSMGRYSGGAVPSEMFLRGFRRRASDSDCRLPASESLL